MCKAPVNGREKNISVNARERVRQKVAHDKAGDGSKGQITRGPEAVLRTELYPRCNWGNISGFKERNHMAQSSTLVTLATTWRMEYWGAAWEQETSPPV